ncbi:hypothetical protein FDECE_1967 [Fusarium decemcellulare]|nr:hypothetical protein FDECE_1967 [Fusarium decemcellulare]
MSANTTGSNAPADVGEALVNAFSNPTGNLTQTVNVTDDSGTPTGQTKARFIIQSKGYFDIKAYIGAGMTFPKDAATFEALHPKDALKALTDLDPDIYAQTEDAMLAVYGSCDDFNTNALPNFRSITNETIDLSNIAISQLTGLGPGSFQGMLDILTSDKYSQPGSENTDEFQGATSGAQQILFDLSQTAKSKAKKIETLAQSITTYGTKIKNLQAQVETVVSKFKGVNNSGGYIDKLNTELKTDRAALQTAANAATSAKADYDHDNTVAQNAVAYIWIPFYGWIAGTTVILTYQNKAKEAWARYQTQLGKEADDNKQIAALEAVIAAVNLLSNQNQTMVDQIGRAQNALSEIQKAFETMSQDLDVASSMMGSAKGFVRASLFERKVLIQSRVQNAVQKYQDTANAAQELLDTDSNIQTSGITPNVAAPKVN